MQNKNGIFRAAAACIAAGMIFGEVSIAAGEESKQEYDITLFSNFYGEIGIDNTPVSNGFVKKVASGGSLKVTFHPNEYEYDSFLADVKINGESNPAAVASGEYVFIDVASDWTIYAVFEARLIPAPCIITATKTAGGEIFVYGSPTYNLYGGGEIQFVGEIPVMGHGTLPLTFKADEGYSIKNVLIDGESNPAAVAAGEYVFVDVMNNHTIHVEFTSDGVSIKPVKSNELFGVRFARNVVSNKAEFEIILPDDKVLHAKVVIYDNVGGVVYKTNGKNTAAFVWNLTNIAGRNVANGTYLIVVEAKGNKGNYVYSAKVGVKK